MTNYTKRPQIIFLQIITVLIAIGALAFLLWEPHLEGRNVNATLFEIYFKDPFLAYVYIASIPFFVACYQTFKVLGNAAQNKVFTPETMKALRTIYYCAIYIIGFVVIGEIFLLLGNRGSDDGPQAFVMGAVISFGSLIAASVAAMLEEVIKDSVGTLSD